MVNKVCMNIGQANTEIAGIGVVTAFVFQALASFLLSILLETLLIPMNTAPGEHNLTAVLNSPATSVLKRLYLRHKRAALVVCRHVTGEVRNATGFIFGIYYDLQENGLKLAVKHAFEADHGVAARHAHATNVEDSPPKRQAKEILADILYSSSDNQTLAGIALALTGIIQRNSLSLYQYHLIYDTINLTSVSNCAALASASAVQTSNLEARIFQMLVFMILYLAFTILFGIRLGQWNYQSPGLCYDAHGLSLPSASHPYVDKIYLGCTCFYMFVTLSAALNLAISRINIDETWGQRRKEFAQLLKTIFTAYNSPYQFMITNSSSLFFETLGGPYRYVAVWFQLWSTNPILQGAMIQLPLHLYFVFRIRLSNEPLLENGSDENRWGFGQIFALITSASLLVECCKGIFQYLKEVRKFEHENANKEQELNIISGDQPDLETSG